MSLPWHFKNIIGIIKIKLKSFFRKICTFLFCFVLSLMKFRTFGLAACHLGPKKDTHCIRQRTEFNPQNSRRREEPTPESCPLIFISMPCYSMSAHTHIHTHTHTRYTHTHTHIDTHKHTQINTYSHRHTHLHRYTHTQTHRCTETHTGTHRYTYHIHTHT